jgi:hypothetical protein
MFAFIPHSKLVRKLVMFPSRKLIRHLRTIRSVYSLMPDVIKRWNSNSQAVHSSLPLLSPQTLSLEHMTLLWRHHSKYVTHSEANVPVTRLLETFLILCNITTYAALVFRCVHPCATLILESLVMSWRTFLRVRALTVHELRRNSFGCPRGFWRA